jgi:hypothetical protein
MSNGLASWVTDASPDASRARIARLVGSEMAASVVLSRSVATTYFTSRLFNLLV